MEQPQEEFVVALYHRVRLAVTDAERTVARSRALTSMRRLLGEQRPVRRCAWCGRFSLGEGWMAESGLPRFVPKTAVEDATHTICPDCEERLVREGKSHARTES